MVKLTHISTDKSYFEIGDHKYHFMLDQMNFDRMKEMLTLAPDISFGMSMASVHDLLQSVYKGLETSGDYNKWMTGVVNAKTQVLNALKIFENIAHDQMIDERLEKVYRAACLFIVRDDEDMTALDERMITAKIEVFKKYLQFEQVFFFVHTVLKQLLTRSEK